MGPDFTTVFFHYRAEFLYEDYAGELYAKSNAQLTDVERGAVKERVKQDFRKQTTLLEKGTGETLEPAMKIIHLF